MQTAQEPPGGPSLWWVWGEMRQAFGRLESLTIGNREAMLEQARHLQLRQDDLRREWLVHMRQMQKRLEKPEKVSSLAWVAHIPWDRVLALLGTVLGAIGWLKPQWVKMLTGG